MDTFGPRPKGWDAAKPRAKGGATKAAVKSSIKTSTRQIQDFDAKIKYPEVERASQCSKDAVVRVRWDKRTGTTFKDCTVKWFTHGGRVVVRVNRSDRSGVKQGGSVLLLAHERELQA